LVESNPDLQFDFFIQSWNPDLKEIFESLYKPQASLYELNHDFAPLLNHYTSLSLLNENAQGKNQFEPDTEIFRQTYAGISQALALQKSIELLNTNVKPLNYELIISTRPDLILLRPMVLSDYRKDAIYVNNYADFMGDFHWVFKPNKRHIFTGLIASIEKGNFHKLHYWIRDYIRDIFGETYIQDKIRAGQDEEVLRQVKYSRIAYKKLEAFGVSKSEYETYDSVS
jgi:hypothetical protein